MKLVSANIVANCEEGGTQPVGHYGGAKVTVRPRHLPNSSIKGDGVRVFLSGHHRPYR